MMALLGVPDDAVEHAFIAGLWLFVFVVAVGAAAWALPDNERE